MRPAEEWIRRLDLAPHPEGGHYRETYRSDGFVPADALPERYGGGRPFATAVLFLLRAGEVSRLHRLASDELWHHYAGGALELCLLSPDPPSERRLLGPDPGAGEAFWALAPAGRWFGARVVRGPYVLAGCTVAPGFSFDDFEMGDRAALERLFPADRELVRELTPGGP